MRMHDTEPKHITEKLGNKFITEFKNDLEKVAVDTLKNDLGYDSDFANEYIVIDIYKDQFYTGIPAIACEIRTELDYDDCQVLASALNNVLNKYFDDEPYFDMENSNTLITYLDPNNLINKEHFQETEIIKEDLPSKPLYIIKDNKGNQLSAPNPDDDELWDRVAAMEARGRRGLSVVVYVDKESNEGPFIKLTDAQAYVDELDFAGAVEIKGDKVYGDETTLKQLADQIYAEYGWSVKLNECSKSNPTLEEEFENFEMEVYNDFVIIKNSAGDGWDIYSYDGTPEKVTKTYLEDEGFATLQAAKDEIDKWVKDAVNEDLNNDTVDLEYEDLEFYHSTGERSYEDGSYDEEDIKMSWKYPVNKIDLYMFMYESCISDDELPDEFKDELDPNNAEEWDKFETWLDDNYDKLFEKYKDKILDNWEEEAIEHATTNYDPEDYIDWDLMYDRYDYDESINEDFNKYRDEEGHLLADKWYASVYPDDEVGVEQLNGLTMDDILKDRKLIDHCDTQVRDRVYKQLDKYSPRLTESRPDKDSFVTVLDESKSINEKVNANFKVGDTFEYSGLYGGSYDGKVIDIKNNQLVAEISWTAEDTGELIKDTTTFEITTDSQGNECIVVWEYHGEKGYVYPESNNNLEESNVLNEDINDSDEVLTFKRDINLANNTDEIQQLIYELSDGVAEDNAQQAFDENESNDLETLKSAIITAIDVYLEDNEWLGESKSIAEAATHNESIEDFASITSLADECGENTHKVSSKDIRFRFVNEDDETKFINKLYELDIPYTQTAYGVAISKSSALDESLGIQHIKLGESQASYGGAFDIADDQYFTREDIENAAEEVMGHIAETFTEPYHLGGTWFENGQWIVNVQGEQFDEYEISLPVDMRKIKEPWHLKRAYANEMAAKLIAQIKEYNGMNEAITSSSYEFDDDIDDLTYYYEDEIFNQNLEENPYTEINSKQVPDSDGFMTDYTMYMDINDGKYVFVLGDKDIYTPTNSEFDWECDDEEEAKEWFTNYNGFSDDELTEWKNNSIDESLESDLSNRYVVSDAHKNRSVVSNIEILKTSEFVDNIKPITKYNTQLFELSMTNGDKFYLVPCTLSQFDVYDDKENLVSRSESAKYIIDELLNGNIDIKFVYKLVGGDCEGTYKEEDLKTLPCYTGEFTADESEIRNQGGFTHRKELDNKPILKGYLGPMMDGWESDHTMVLRYETQDIYNALSH